MLHNVIIRGQINETFTSVLLNFTSEAFVLEYENNSGQTCKLHL